MHTISAAHNFNELLFSKSLRHPGCFFLPGNTFQANDVFGLCLLLRPVLFSSIRSIRFQPRQALLFGGLWWLPISMKIKLWSWFLGIVMECSRFVPPIFLGYPLWLSSRCPVLRLCHWGSRNSPAYVTNGIHQYTTRHIYVLAHLRPHPIYLSAAIRANRFYYPVLDSSVAISFDQEYAAAVAIGVLSVWHVTLIDVS